MQFGALSITRPGRPSTSSMYKAIFGIIFLARVTTMALRGLFNSYCLRPELVGRANNWFRLMPTE